MGASRHPRAAAQDHLHCSHFHPVLLKQQQLLFFCVGAFCGRSVGVSNGKGLKLEARGDWGELKNCPASSSDQTLSCQVWTIVSCCGGRMESLMTSLTENIRPGASYSKGLHAWRFLIQLRTVCRGMERTTKISREHPQLMKGLHTVCRTNFAFAIFLRRRDRSGSDGSGQRCSTSGCAVHKDDKLTLRQYVVRM